MKQADFSMDIPRGNSCANAFSTCEKMNSTETSINLIQFFEILIEYFSNLTKLCHRKANHLCIDLHQINAIIYRITLKSVLPDVISLEFKINSVGEALFIGQVRLESDYYSVSRSIYLLSKPEQAVHCGGLFNESQNM